MPDTKKKVVVAFSCGLDTSYTVMKLTQDGYDEYGDYNCENDYTYYHRGVTFFPTKKEALTYHVEETIKKKERNVSDAEKALNRAKKDLEEYRVKAQAVIDALNE